MRQGWVSMAPAIKELERAIVGRKLVHGGHEVLRWNFSCEPTRPATRALIKVRVATASTVQWRP
jgi:phage terminase large subunit-like protein